jgi:hypothetical protein
MNTSKQAKPESITPIAAGYEADAGPNAGPQRRPVVAVAEDGDGNYRACIIDLNGLVVFAPGLVQVAKPPH